jgi:signal transduction histidine kinase
VVTAIRDRTGAVTGFVSISHDVTARLEAERTLERRNGELFRMNDQLENRIRERTWLLEARTAELISVNAELETFSYSVSHDLRAPIRVVQGFTRIVRERYGELIPAEGHDYLDRIEAGAVRTGELIDALLRLARMQRQPISASLVDMSDLVAHCWHVLAQHYPGHRVELSVRPLEPVVGDPQLLGQVWMNLLDNAVKYSTGRVGARVEVSSTVRDDMVVFQVRDNGAGLDSRYVDRLFESFQRLRPGQDFTGTGIGLPLAHRVLLRHGGRIWADGQLGVGSTFSFELRKASHAVA